MNETSVDDPEQVDVLRYETAAGPSYRSVPAGDGERIVAAHEEEFRKRTQLRLYLVAIIASALVSFGLLYGSVYLLAGVLGAGLVYAIGRVTAPDHDEYVPQLVDERLRADRARSTYDIDIHSSDPWTDQPELGARDDRQLTTDD